MNSLLDHLDVCILDRVLSQDSVTPVSRGPADLSAHVSLGSQSSERLDPVRLVLAKRVPGEGPARLGPGVEVRVPDDSRDRVLILADDVREGELEVPVVVLVLERPDKVPPLDEVLGEVHHHRASHLAVNVVPGHPGRRQARLLVRDPLLDSLEVLHASVVVVLPHEERRREVSRVHVREQADVCVPPSEAQVESSNARNRVVDDDQLLVCESEHLSGRCGERNGHGLLLTVTPHEGNLSTEVIRVAHDSNVLVHVLQVMLGVRRTERHRLSNLLVHDTAHTEIKVSCEVLK